IADSALTSTIAELREVLDDEPRSPRYIATLPKRGYRLVAPVSAGTSSAATTAPEAVAHPPDERARWSRPSRRSAFGLGAAFAVAVTVSIASRRWSVTPTPPPVRPLRLTVQLPRGVRLAPDTVPRLALTSDGSRMAYVVRTDAGLALYTRTLDQ